jgi:hypothetical protein
MVQSWWLLTVGFHQAKPVLIAELKKKHFPWASECLNAPIVDSRLTAI